jgi:tripartite-type tricarboxylate transporter receptor subunit TctC
MKLLRREVLALGAGVAALASLTATAHAQSYPARPVTMVVPFAAGGPVDTIGRIVAERLQAALGQPFVIENVAGAAGTTGVGRAARAPADGYTLSVGSVSTHVMNGAIYNKLGYDPLADFEPIAMVASSPLLLVGKKSLPADDLKGLVGWLKQNPDKATQGTFGAGNISHVTGLYFQKETGTRYAFVPYRGAALAMQDLLAGQIDIVFDFAVTAVPQVRAGTVKGYAVTAKTRLAATPDVPTAEEVGLQGFDITYWNAIWAPKGTPKEIVARLNGVVMDALADPAVRKRLEELGQDVPAREQQTPEALAALEKAEAERWWPIIKAANIKVE